MDHVLRDGGGPIILYRLWPLASYWYGLKENIGNYSEINLCTSMHISVSSIDLGATKMCILRLICIICFIGIVQYLQFGYQKGLLYRLKALGERHNMDITIEGFHSWMWRGLSFLLPFLFIGYSFQAYNAWTLYKLAFNPPDAPWHVSHRLNWIFLYLPLLPLKFVR